MHACVSVCTWESHLLILMNTQSDQVHRKKVVCVPKHFKELAPVLTTTNH